MGEAKGRLKVCDERIAALAAPVLAEIKGHDNRDELTNQMIAEKSADANFKNATLAREIAEIAVIEYVEGIAKQDEATIEGEIKLAESELARAKDGIEFARQQLTKVKEASNLSCQSLPLNSAMRITLSRPSGGSRKPRSRSRRSGPS